MCSLYRRALVALTASACLTPAVASAEPPPPARTVSFDQAIAAALAHNPSSAIAKQEIRRAAALVEQARASALPTLSAGASYTVWNGQRILGSNSAGGPVSSNNELSAALSLSVPLLAAKAWMGVSHAADALDALRASDSDVRRVTALAAGHAYLAVVAQKRVALVDEIAERTAKAHFEFAHQRFAGGVGNQLDEVRAEQQLRALDAEVEQAYAALERAREALGVFLGQDEPIDADVPSLAEPPPLAKALEEAARRSDVVAARRRTLAAAHVKRDDWADYTPTLNFVFQPGYQTPATTSVPQTGWEALFVLTLPLYDGGLRYGQAKERDALLEESRILEANTGRQARSDVRAAYASLVRADTALRSSRDAAGLATRALELAERAYRAGATTNIEVIDAERAAHDADAQAVIAEDTARQARLDMLAAAGVFP